MTSSLAPFDVVLGVMLVALAWQLLRARDVFTGIVLFMVLGLLTSLAWVRLGAPDLALAEAAIGAGLTGALFLGALGRMEARDPGGFVARARGGASRAYHIFLLFPLAGFIVVLCRGVWLLPATAAGLREPVEAALHQAGVENRVTAVILNFRGYDTLLEIGVLFIAALGVFALYDTEAKRRPRVMPAVGWILTVFLHILAPVMVVTAGYFLWMGAHAPGGAFQAGAVLAAAGVVLRLAGARISFTIEKPLRRWAAGAGFLVFLLAGVSMMGAGRNFLEYELSSAKRLMLLIEGAATVSIAFALAALFAGCAALLGRPPSGGDAAGGQAS